MTGMQSFPESVAETMCVVGDLLFEHDRIAEIDVNPVLSRPNGTLALDTLVTLTEVND